MASQDAGDNLVPFYSAAGFVRSLGIYSSVRWWCSFFVKTNKNMHLHYSVFNFGQKSHSVKHYYRGDY